MSLIIHFHEVPGGCTGCRFRVNCRPLRPEKAERASQFRIVASVEAGPDAGGRLQVHIDDQASEQGGVRNGSGLGQRQVGRQ